MSDLLNLDQMTDLVDHASYSGAIRQLDTMIHSPQPQPIYTGELYSSMALFATYQRYLQSLP